MSKNKGKWQSRGGEHNWQERYYVGRHFRYPKKRYKENMQEPTN